MKHLQIELSDQQHRTLKLWCASNNITLKTWLQDTFETALEEIDKELAATAREHGKLYAAYGSNLNLRQMAFRCPTAVPIVTAELPGYNLLFRGGDGNAVATIEPGDDTVPVLLWRIRPGDEKALDSYEGYPKFYRKENLDVEVSGQNVSVMAYVMNDGHPLGSPSHWYLDTITGGL